MMLGRVKEPQKVITVTDFEQRVLIEALADRRNDFIAGNQPTEDVNTVLLKVIDAPDKKSAWRDGDRDER